jgi:hypothetical protein
LRIVTVRRGGHLIGALPLYLHIGRRSPLWAHHLGFLSTGESRSEVICPGYLDLLHAPGEARTCLDAILPALLDPEVGRWDILDLCDIDRGSPLLAWRDQAPRDIRVVVIPRGACPVADLSGGFEAYLGRLSARGRKRARQMLRAVESTGIRFEVASTPSDAAQFFDQLVRLHQARWNLSGRPGCFSAHRFTEFHRTLAELWVPTGKAILARLARDGEPLAVHYGFINGTKYDQYQSGVDFRAAGRVKSPGIAAHLALMRYLADRGIMGYDFLLGYWNIRTVGQRHATRSSAFGWCARASGLRPTRRSKRRSKPPSGRRGGWRRKFGGHWLRLVNPRATASLFPEFSEVFYSY